MLQLSWEGCDKVNTQVHSVVHRLQPQPRTVMVVHLNRIVPYLVATWDQHPMYLESEIILFSVSLIVYHFMQVFNYVL
jgi:hypothetical protein